MSIGVTRVAVGFCMIMWLIGCPRIRRDIPEDRPTPAVVTAPGSTPAGPAKVAGTTWREPHTGIRFPTSIGELRHRSVRHFGGRLGVRVRYETKGYGWIDIYVYKGGFTTIPPGPSSVAVEHAFKVALKNIQRLADIGRYRQLVVMGKVPQRLTPGGPWVLSRRLTYTSGGVAHDSYLYLTAFKNHFIKVRAAFSATQDRSGIRLNMTALRRILTRILTP